MPNLRPGLSGALFLWWLSEVEATKEKSGNGRRMKAPKTRKVLFP